MTATTRERRVADLTALLDSGDTVQEDETLSVDLYLRSLSPPAGTHAGQQSRLERLSELYEAGNLGTLRVSVWGDQLCLCESCASTRAGRRMLDTVEKFEAWAAQADGEVALPLDRRRVQSAYAETDRETLSVPQFLMAVYAGPSLVAVFPHTAGNTSYSVTDGIMALSQSLHPSRSVVVE
jgi:hypothetical protein